MSRTLLVFGWHIGCHLSRGMRLMLQPRIEACSVATRKGASWIGGEQAILMGIVLRV